MCLSKGLKHEQKFDGKDEKEGHLWQGAQPEQSMKVFQELCRGRVAGGIRTSGVGCMCVEGRRGGWK